ncbi:uncharacterized protein [Symphalangus syndactylus]|uniref:uncharacterized protein n=1 Tax=Symphalangus syndactylus TaxID=9590 RepID=UPI00300528C3
MIKDVSEDTDESEEWGEGAELPRPPGASPSRNLHVFSCTEARKMYHILLLVEVTGVYTKVNYVSIKCWGESNEALTYATPRMNLENIMLSKRSQTQKAAQCMILFTCNVQNSLLSSEITPSLRGSKILKVKQTGNERWRRICCYQCKGQAEAGAENLLSPAAARLSRSEGSPSFAEVSGSGSEGAGPTPGRRKKECGPDAVLALV